MRDRYNVLFLCNENSARSIFAEALLNHRGGRDFRAFSAGPKAKGFVHPQTLEQLELVHLPTQGLRSKNWAELAKSGAPSMDFVFSMCDEAAQEVCPTWPGLAITGDWDVPDPTVAKGTREAVEKAFESVFGILQRRIDLFVALPLDKVSQMATRSRRRAAAA